jgi:hypothetical protein
VPRAKRPHPGRCFGIRNRPSRLRQTTVDRLLDDHNCGRWAQILNQNGFKTGSAIGVDIVSRPAVFEIHESQGPVWTCPSPWRSQTLSDSALRNESLSAPRRLEASSVPTGNQGFNQKSILDLS